MEEGEVRKRVAAFYTEPAVAELAAWLAVERFDERVADFAVGSGRLLEAAYRRKRFLLESEGLTFSEEDHRRFLWEELLGVDIVPLAAKVAARRLAALYPGCSGARVAVAVWDSTELEPGMVIPATARPGEVLKGQMLLDAFLQGERRGGGERGLVCLNGECGEGLRLGFFDVVLMNPPFTRQERIPNEYKRALFDRLKEYREYMDGRMGLHGYFVFLADRFLKEGGRMALILPASTLKVRSMKGVRRLLAEKYHVEYIIAPRGRANLSEDTSVREILLVARKREAEPGAVTAVIFLEELPRGVEEARRLAEAVRRLPGAGVDARVLGFEELRGSVESWYWVMAFRDEGLARLLKEVSLSPLLTELSQLFEVRSLYLKDLMFHGFHGFIVSDERRAARGKDGWVAARVEGDHLTVRHVEYGLEVKVPLSSLEKCMRKYHYARFLDASVEPDYLVLAPFEGLEKMVRLTVGRSLQIGEEVFERWRRVVEKRRGRVLVSSKVDISSPGLSLLAFYSDEPMVGVHMWMLRGGGVEAARVTALWLNSSFNLLQTLAERREVSGVWMKVDAYVLRESRVPNLSLLRPEDKLRLLEVFEKWRRVELPSIVKQLEEGHPFRRETDEAFAAALGLRVDFDDLYARLLKEVEGLMKVREKRGKGEGEGARIVKVLQTGGTAGL